MIANIPWCNQLTFFPWGLSLYLISCSMYALSSHFPNFYKYIPLIMNLMHHFRIINQKTAISKHYIIFFLQQTSLANNENSSKCLHLLACLVASQLQRVKLLVKNKQAIRNLMSPIASLRSEVLQRRSWCPIFPSDQDFPACDEL